MTRGNLERFAPLTGVVAVVLFVIAAVIGGETPGADDPTREVVDFYTDEDSSQIWASVIAAWGSVFLVWFGGTVRAALRSAEGQQGRISAIAFAGFILMGAGILAFCGIGFSAADTAGEVPPEVTQTLSVLNSDFFFILAGGTAVTLLASGIGIVRYGGLPGWLGYVGLVLGILALTPIGFLAFLASGIWFLVVAVMLFLAGREAPARSPAT
jgi:hypothetical protein